MAGVRCRVPDIRGHYDACAEPPHAGPSDARPPPQATGPGGPLLAASLAQVKKRCGQPSCRCHHGGPLHPAHHLTFRRGVRPAPCMCPRTCSRRSKNGCKNTNVSRPDPRNQPVDPGLDPGPRLAPKAPAGTTLNIGPILAETLGHFFPDLNTWIDAIPDARGSPPW